MVRDEGKVSNESNGGSSKGNGSSHKSSLRWVSEDTRKRQREQESRHMERNRKLAERDAEYAKMFPQLVRRSRIGGRREFQNSPNAEMWRRYA